MWASTAGVEVETMTAVVRAKWAVVEAGVLPLVVPLVQAGKSELAAVPRCLAAADI